MIGFAAIIGFALLDRPLSTPIFMIGFAAIIGFALLDRPAFNTDLYDRLRRRM